MTLSELEKLESLATPGPWVNDYWAGKCPLDHLHGRAVCKYDYYYANSDISHHHISVADVNDRREVVTTTDEYGALDKDDGALIVALRNNAKALIAVAQAARDCLFHDIDVDLNIKYRDALAKALLKLDEIK